MGSAFNGVDVVGIGEDIFRISVGPLKSDFYFAVLLYHFIIYDGIVYGSLVLVLELHLLLDTAFVAVGFLLFLFSSFVLEAYLETLV